MLELLRILIYYPFLNLLMFFIWLVPDHNAAWGIILLTIAVRLLLLIPSMKATQAQRKMTQLQPLLNELKEEYGDDRQGLMLAQMELYKKNNINPLASCFLTLIQLPFLYILYFAIIHGLDPQNPHLYSWLPRPDHVNTLFLGYDLLKRDPTHFFPVFAAVLQYLQIRMMLPTMPAAGADGAMDTMAATQRHMLYIMPLFTLFIALNFPVGTVLYWIVTTLFTIGQQYVVNRERLRLRGLKEAREEAEEAHEARKRVKVRRTGGNASSTSSTPSSPALSAGKAATPAPVRETTKKGVTVRVRKKGS
jgi:YidC/Oxa1 family membrane protein insertase